MKFKRKIFDFMTLDADNDVGELYVYGEIADDKWYDDDVTVGSVRDALKDMGSVKILELHINSYGGSVNAGNTIVNLIDRYKNKTGCKVVTYIDGIAASMASGVAMAGDVVYMAQNAIFMVHKPSTIAWGDSDEMLKTAEILEKVEDTLVKNYMRHFKGTEDELRELISEESWLTANEAYEYGFCEEIVEPIPVAASANGLRINGTNFKNEKIFDKFKTNERDDVEVFEYDEKLSALGIDEETFKTFNVSADTVEQILNAVPAGSTVSENTDHAEFLAKASEALGVENADDDTIIGYAKAGISIDNSAADKAKMYDKLVDDAISDAIKSGIRAKGDTFNEAKWKKILNSLDYSEIIDQKNEWEAEAKLVLKAGKRVSQVASQKGGCSDKSAVNLDDYKI